MSWLFEFVTDLLQMIYIDDITDEELVSTVKPLQDNSAEDKEVSFANSVDCRLRRLPRQQKAIA